MKLDRVAQRVDAAAAVMVSHIVCSSLSLLLTILYSIRPSLSRNLCLANLNSRFEWSSYRT